MNSTTSERDAFLRAIIADPADDVRRLAFADWLDENAGTVECRHCEGEGRIADAGGSGLMTTVPASRVNTYVRYSDDRDCPTCRGTGQVSDGDPDRAEFIRVQCELARLPPKPRELFVADGAGTRMEHLGVALIPKGGGHYSASNAERGLSTETFSLNERVDIYAHLARNNRVGWMRGLRYVKTIENRNEIIFRKDAESGPWVGTALAIRESALLDTNRAEWLRGPACEKCRDGKLYCPGREHRHGGEDTDCHACQGTGDAGALTWELLYDYEVPQESGTRREPVRVTFRRGFPARVEVPRLADCIAEETEPCPTCLGGEIRPTRSDNYDPCEECHGVNTVTRTVPSPWLAAVVASHPVEEVVCLDREPFQHPGGVYLWHQSDSGRHPDSRDELPTALLTEDVVKTHLTRELAITALARAIVAFARSSSLTDSPA